MHGDASGTCLSPLFGLRMAGNEDANLITLIILQKFAELFLAIFLVFEAC